MRVRNGSTFSGEGDLNTVIFLTIITIVLLTIFYIRLKPIRARHKAATAATRRLALLDPLFDEKYLNHTVEWMWPRLFDAVKNDNSDNVDLWMDPQAKTVAWSLLNYGESYDSIRFQKLEFRRVVKCWVLNIHNGEGDDADSVTIASRVEITSRAGQKGNNSYPIIWEHVWVLVKAQTLGGVSWRVSDVHPSKEVHSIAQRNVENVELDQERLQSMMLAEQAEAITLDGLPPLAQWAVDTNASAHKNLLDASLVDARLNPDLAVAFCGTVVSAWSETVRDGNNVTLPILCGNDTLVVEQMLYWVSAKPPRVMKTVSVTFNNFDVDTGLLFVNITLSGMFQQYVPNRGWFNPTAQKPFTLQLTLKYLPPPQATVTSVGNLPWVVISASETVPNV